MNELKKYLLVVPFLLASFYACQQTVDNESEETIPKEEMDDNTTRITEKQFDASKFELGKIEKNSFSSTLVLSGKLHLPAKGKAVVSNFIGGKITGFNLIHGEWVKKGQRLFTLSNPELIVLQQKLLEIQGQLQYLELEYERQKKLADENISAKKNYLKAQSEYQLAKTSKAVLAKKLNLIGIDPNGISPETVTSSVSVFAPQSGVVSMLNIVNGKSLQPAEAALEISNLNHIHLELNVLEKDIHLLSKGQNVSFKLQNDHSKKYKAKIHLIEKLIDENRMVNVHCHIDNEMKGTFLPGMFVSAEIELDEISAFSLPEEAIVNLDGQAFVLRRKNGAIPYEFEPFPVKTGMTKNGYTQLIGLDARETSNEFLVKGAYYLLLADE